MVEGESVSRPVAGAVATVLCLLLLGCGKATVSGRQAIGTLPSGRPSMIYIADFELDAETVRSEPGLLPRPGAPVDPARHARELADLMANSLVSQRGQIGR